MSFDLFKPLCPQCYTDNSTMHTTYMVQSRQTRQILRCHTCGNYFSETSGTPLADLHTPLSRIQQILTAQNLAEAALHAHHVEAFNSALRRQLACFRRKANTYAKLKSALQRRLDVYRLLHNFIRPHFTTKMVPAVALGIFAAGLSWVQLFTIQTFPFN